MKKIELNHWFVEDNELKISLMRYFIKISICQNNESIFYRLEVIKKSKTSLIFNFYSLSDAIRFTEETVKKCTKTSEIVEEYITRFEKVEFNPAKNNEKNKIIKRKYNKIK